MKFSLIVCTYMRPDALLTLLKTVNQQTLYPDEILIVDGSTDDKTENVLEQNTFRNLRYFKVDYNNRGLTKQRNFGVSKLRDDIKVVCFLDDDILLTPDYFKQLISTYTLKPEALAVGGYITNEISWEKATKADATKSNKFVYDGYVRNEGSRFILRKKLGLIDDTKPGFMPTFSNGRSVSFLPPSGKVYQVEQLMGGVSSYKTEIFKSLSFSTYFEGYGLYEDADFSLRLAKRGKLYINTNAQLEHHHASGGRPNLFKYGKMVLRNGWYVWHVKYPNPNLKARFKWNAIAFVLTTVRYLNVVTTPKRKEALTEALGRTYGWWSLLLNKPKNP